MIIAVIDTTFTAGKRRPEKNSGLHGIRTFDLCDTRAALYQLNCTGIAEVKGSNPVQAGIFFRLSFRNCKSCVYNYRDHPSFTCNSSLRSSHNMIFIYSKLHLKNTHALY